MIGWWSAFADVRVLGRLGPQCLGQLPVRIGPYQEVRTMKPTKRTKTDLVDFFEPIQPVPDQS